MADSTKGPFTAVNSPQNVGLSYGLDIQAQVPADGRTIVDTVEQMYNLLYVMKGLEVFVRGINRKFRFNRANHPNFTAANNPAWWDDLTGTVATMYLGTFDATGPFTAGTRPDGSALVNGDFYIVSKAGNTAVGTITEWTVGDMAMYNTGSGWQRIPNYAPAPPTQILHTGVTDWDEATSNEIAAKATLFYNEDASYRAGQVVMNVVSVPASGSTPAYTFINQYKAKRAIVPADNLTDTNAWQLVSTTDYSQLANRLIIDNQAGLLANVTTPTDNGAGKLLDAQEIDRRILANKGAGASGPINGGDSSYALNDPDYGIAQP